MAVQRNAKSRRLALRRPPARSLPAAADWDTKIIDGWGLQGYDKKTPPIIKSRKRTAPTVTEYPMKFIKDESGHPSPPGLAAHEEQQDGETLLNATIGDDVYIDTADLCARVVYELKQHSIPQSCFAEKILCRSQGTLSDLLRNPRPWNELKSGRETFRRMFNWLQQPLHVRLTILDMYNGPNVSRAAENQRRTSSSKTAKAEEKSPPASASKKGRFVFTDVQKRTLMAIFNETQRPSREMQETIARHLSLSPSSVANFFMNQRRRHRKQEESFAE
ncbi:One cut domain family member [Aphelenchoides fujianensis]|nr:One cut domain family member [Aphelenchoides fujianensis]